MADYVLSARIVAEVDNFTRNMRSVASESGKTARAVDRATNSISKAVTSNLAGIFSTAAVVAFGKAVLTATSEFQKFNAVLGNTLSSASLATIKLKEIQEFAAKTPFSVNELTGAFVKLANSGFKPTGDQMRALGDLASSTGKSFDQLAEAILDAQSGEFERLKEFGVRAKDAGDSVIFTYKGVQTQVEKTSEAIRGYITNLGNAVGTSGSMAKISATLGGQISNLGDTWDQMLLSVGANTSGVFNKSISVIGRAIEKITQYNEELNVASQYNLGSDFGSQLNRAINPFASKGATDVELGVSLIKEARKESGKLASSMIDSARSAADFGKALAAIKKQGDAALTSPAIRSENVRKGISEAYQLAVKAIQDARAAFNSAEKGGANFGTSTTKSVKTVSDVLKQLELDLKISSLQFGKTFSSENADKVNNYQKAIDALAGIAGGKAAESIKKLRKEQERLLAIFSLPKSMEIAPLLSPKVQDTKGRSIANKGRTDKIGLATSTQMNEAGDYLSDEQKRIIESQMRFNEEMSDLISSGLSNSLMGIGESIGTALAEGGNVFEAVGKGLLSSLGDILSQMGQAAIKIGIGLGAIKTALKSLNPAVAIAAGVGLVALGAFFKSKMAATGGSMDRGGQTTAFANGGIVSGPTRALVGEYSGARNNPEVISPLNKLNSYISGSIKRALSEGVNTPYDSFSKLSSASIGRLAGSFQPIMIAGEFMLRGENLVASAKRTETRLNRQ